MRKRRPGAAIGERRICIARPAGTKVWLTAAYVGFRGQVGEGCAPISTVLAGGTMNLQRPSSQGGDTQLKAAGAAASGVRTTKPRRST